MTSEQNPDRPPARRRMAGYTPLAAPANTPPDAVRAPEPDAPDLAVEHHAPEQAARAPAEAGQNPQAHDSVTPIVPDPTSEEPAAPAASTAPARKTRMAGPLHR